MTRVTKVLVIGGGFSGMSAAISLRRHGVAVDLVEADPDWNSYGAGISIGGATLRAFRELGVLDRFLAEGAAFDGTEVRAPDDRVLTSLPTPRVAGEDVPGCAAVMRPVLGRILADAVRAAGVGVRLGQTLTDLQELGDGVRVTFPDGGGETYDLVVGADGLYSRTRAALMPEAPVPAYSGQSVWRAVLPRHPDVNRTLLWVAEHTKVGLNPVSEEEMYLFVNEDKPAKEWVDPQEFASRLRVLLQPFPAEVVQWAADRLGTDSLINFRPLEGLLVRTPWHRGRVVLIGDAVHATTPHLASGACLGIEDGIVLAEELANGPTVEAALTSFGQRRWERSRMVVENSAELGRIEIAGGDPGEHMRIMRESFLALAEQI